MLDTYRTLITNQYEAAFCTLNACIENCPDALWNAPVAKYPFCQVVFHALFYGDYYLGINEASLREQRFHRENVEFFGDYEQRLDREPVSLYEKTALLAYLEHCREKARDVIAAETSESLAERCGFRRREISRAELHVYNIRHIQHHDAQLILRLRIDIGADIPWFGSGWRDD